ncbi:uncharacterized protein BDZ99DRAFT_461249 [Mytilinidion resinicola]|uniref:Uncharacterized protein n=1 Tax=Mytilinidion resinicola TaxID=574789 RepID=A0A6A6YUZ7_9PEZI|nr:uncharacterized protein BDZ99DRAFT_461249 [Mytilinidion resinicola]KAF2812590.1 hypothetical protein BDZ99DRAFT_461249 [Mytilinidion resinicola]
MCTPKLASGTSSARPIGIFSSYMLLCLSLAILILRSLYKSSQRRSFAQNLKPNQSRSTRRVVLFTVLSAISLGTTWYYMFCFFSHSYQQWSSRQSIHLSVDGSLELGAWLRDTKLFKEAWGTALETPERFWWTQQIFFFTSIWSVFLGQQGFSRRIPHLWAYMLLGQVVAISFATNLFFLAVSLNPASPPAFQQDPSRWTPPLSILLIPLLATFVSTGMMPISVSKPYFMYILLLPHFALFMPPVLYSVVPQSWGTTHRSLKAAERYYERVYSLLVMLSIVFIALASRTAWGGVLTALYEHPAVSSVGWDVILCWISWGFWTLVQQFGASDVRREGKGKQL